jgi:hypothetical protein
MIIKESVFIFGRLIGDQEGKISSQNVYLDDPDISQKVKIDLSTVQSYHIFPGQYVVLKGYHSLGN